MPLIVPSVKVTTAKPSPPFPLAVFPLIVPPSKVVDTTKPSSPFLRCFAPLRAVFVEFVDSVAGTRLCGVPARRRAGVGVQRLAIKGPISTIGYSKGT